MSHGNYKYYSRDLESQILVETKKSTSKRGEEMEKRNLRLGSISFSITRWQKEETMSQNWQGKLSFFSAKALDPEIPWTFFAIASTTPMYVCMVTYVARVLINRVRLPILLVVS